MTKKMIIKKTFRQLLKISCLIALIFSFVIVNNLSVYATTVEEPTVVTETDNDTGNILGINISTTEDGGLSGALQIVLVLTVIALCPSILIMLTSFTRIIIVLHFTRSALNTQTTPPNQVLIGLALFLTVFIMAPVFNEINTNAIKPLNKGEITQEEALEAGMEPIKTFMLNNVRDEDLDAMASVAGIESISTREEIPLRVLIPAFMLSEIRIAFWIGFLIYIPFVVIDMVVSSTLMAMGMMMLPPTTISLPFKILLFVLADGWNLIIVNLMKTFIV
ncbi:MAG: flagellar type III secretion system pore protein FliP [Lachnospiraceae bacterium]|nr:flagellar type III secretion system pore protein FliP [Lachnospiraceae bacterium]